MPAISLGYFRILLPALLLFSPLLCKEAGADFYTHSWEDHRAAYHLLNIDGTISYYATNANYDQNGNGGAIQGLQSYGRLQTDLTAAYGLIEKLSVFGRASWARLQLNSSLISAVTYGFLDQTIGLNYRIYETRPTGKRILTTLDIQAQLDFPAYNNNASGQAGAPFLGDGSMDYSIGPFLTLPVMQGPTDYIVLAAGLGYTYRSLGFSAAIPWSLTAKYFPINDGFYASAMLSGIRSLQTDLRGFSPVSIGAAGSFMVNAVDPSLVMVNAQVGYQTNPKLAITLGASETLSGVSAPSGYALFLGVQIHADNPMSAGAPINAAKMLPEEYGRANQGLVYYSLDAKVLRANDRLNIVKIDKGKQDGVEVGQVFDIFNIKPDGSVKESIARGKVTAAKLSEAVLEITEYYKEVWIDEGFIAKRVIQ